MRNTLLTKAFWFDAIERAVKTFAQSIVAVAGGDAVLDTAITWNQTMATAGLAAGLSILTSIASSAKSNTESPASLMPNMNPPAG